MNQKCINSIVFSIICILIQLQSFAQNKNTITKIYTVNKINSITLKNNLDTSNLYYKFNTKNPIPKRAAMYSALLPGLGQAYNKQYWKIPIVYGGIATFAYIFNYQYNNYIKYQSAFIARSDNNPNTVDDFPNYSASDLRLLERQYRQSLDKIVVYSALFYTANIIDALVGAHLKNFDVTPSISLKLHPTYTINNQIGMALQINIIKNKY